MKKEQHDKESQRKAIIEIMKADEEAGLYEPFLPDKEQENSAHGFTEGCLIADDEHDRNILSALSPPQEKPEKEEGWISVKDRLPIKTENYLVWLTKYRSDNTTISHHSIVWYSNSDKTFNVEPYVKPHTAFDKTEVIYWQPLPNPPKA